VREKDNSPRAREAAPPPDGPPVAAPPPHPVVSQLIAQGVDAACAPRLLADCGEARCRQALDSLQGQRRKVRNSGGWIASALRRGWNLAPPDPPALPRYYQPYRPPTASRPAPPPPKPPAPRPAAEETADLERLLPADVFQALKERAIAELIPEFARNCGGYVPSTLKRGEATPQVRFRMRQLLRRGNDPRQ